jgi:hypothetical protein
VDRLGSVQVANRDLKSVALYVDRYAEVYGNPNGSCAQVCVLFSGKSGYPEPLRFTILAFEINRTCLGNLAANNHLLASSSSDANT